MAMNPSELARETLKRLAMQRTPPTPDNYRTLYHEIAGTVVTEAFPEKALKAVAAGLPRGTPEQLRFARGQGAGTRVEFSVQAFGLSLQPVAEFRLGRLTRSLCATAMAVEFGLIRAGLRWPLGGSLLLVARKV